MRNLVYNISLSLLILAGTFFFIMITLTKILAYDKGEEGSYIIKKNDTLYSIARKHDLSVSELVAYNGLRCNFIKTGERLSLNKLSDDFLQSPEYIRSEEVRCASLDNSLDSGLRNIANRLSSIDLVTHKVETGDSLNSISNFYGVNVHSIKEYNNIKSSNVTVGKTLIIPVTKKNENIERSKVVVNEARKFSNDSDITPDGKDGAIVKNAQRIHEIKTGENLYNISKIYGVSISDIRKVNNLDSGDLTPGQQLIIASPSTLKIAAKAILNRVSGTIGNVNDNISTSADSNDDNSSKAHNYFSKTINKYSAKNNSLNNYSENIPDYHIVKRGDTLYSIARKNNVTVYSLKVANDLNNNTIEVGQKLYFDDISDVNRSYRIAFEKNKKIKKYIDSDNAVKKVRVIAPKPIKGQKFHRVKKGETLYRISRWYGISIAELRAINNIGRDLTIYPGQKLWVTPIQERRIVYNEVKDKLNKASNYVGERVRKYSYQASVPVPVPAPKGETKMFHIVKPGEDSKYISRLYGVTEGELLAANNLTFSDKITTGQKLWIKSLAKGRIVSNIIQDTANKASDFIGRVAEKYKNQPTKPVALSAEVGEGVDFHTVRPGENLADIATLYNIELYELRAANNLITDDVYERQKIWIRDVSTAREAYETFTSTGLAVYSNTLETAKNILEKANDPKEPFSKNLSDGLFTKLQDATLDYVSTYFKEAASGTNFKWVDFSFSGDARGDFTAEATTLYALTESNRNLTYLQFGGIFGEEDYTIHAGLGNRYLLNNDWMVGINSFIDRTRIGHTRGSVGLEVTHRLLDVYYNKYFAITGWIDGKEKVGKLSRKEKVLGGYDFGAKGRLPFYEDFELGVSKYKWSGQNEESLQKGFIVSGKLDFDNGVYISGEKNVVRGSTDTGEFKIGAEISLGLEEFNDPKSPTNVASVWEKRYQKVNREYKVYVELDDLGYYYIVSATSGGTVVVIA